MAAPQYGEARERAINRLGPEVTPTIPHPKTETTQRLTTRDEKRTPYIRKDDANCCSSTTSDQQASTAHARILGAPKTPKPGALFSLPQPRTRDGPEKAPVNPPTPALCSCLVAPTRFHG